MTGVHLSEFARTDFSQELGNKLGQTLWDFYMFQIHGLRKVHADPHPGNFLINKEEELIAIDFGCIKEVPDSFYVPYFELAKKDNISNDTVFTQKLYELEILIPADTKEEIKFFKALFHEMLSLFTSPFHEETFDFGNGDFWNKIAALSEHYASDKEIRKMNGNRGSKHFLYMNRTFFGLYNLLHDLKANIKVNNYKQYLS
jgi:serine/threonine protein kinase